MDMMWYRRRGLMVTPHIESASGSIASFNSDYNKIPVKSLICNIEPIQAGSGDPSPENVRPISGRTGLSVTRTGNNLIDVQNISCPAQINNQYNIGDYITLPAGNYTLSFTINKTVTGTRNRPLYYGRNTVYCDEDFLTAGRKSWTFTLSEETRLQLKWWAHTLSTDITISDFMLELGSTATDYEPYKGSTYTVNWETEAGTVYGGTLDVVRGKLVVDRAFVEFDNASVWSTITTSNIFRYSTPNPAIKAVETTQIVNAITNETTVTRYRYDVMKENYPSFSADAQGRMYIAISDDISTKENLDTWLQSNPLQICYEIAEPFEIQLTTQEARTLLGENNIWCNTGDVTVDYWKWGK